MCRRCVHTIASLLQLGSGNGHSMKLVRVASRFLSVGLPRRLTVGGSPTHKNFFFRLESLAHLFPRVWLKTLEVRSPACRQDYKDNKPEKANEE
jgi:hypothetical protein